MEDEAILLKIKRDFTTNEAVQSLLKIVSQLEMEIGVLKQEVIEEKDMVKKIRTEKLQTKKQWMQEEMFEFISKENDHLKVKVKEYKKSMEDWRIRYFNLMASSTK